MSTVTVSPKYQVVIPQDVRRHMSIKPGQKLVAMAWGDHIVLVPQRPIHEIQALFKGMVNDFERERDREF
ncbi:hypothetical protein IP88_05605 [alpha proteobacterium AAP81b]|nr:hypothetical protein IP88_05605 [alpha proteobacterium AAP81b]